jgi:hypothetical protein
MFVHQTRMENTVKAFSCIKLSVIQMSFHEIASSDNQFSFAANLVALTFDDDLARNLLASILHNDIIQMSPTIVMLREYCGWCLTVKAKQ